MSKYFTWTKGDRRCAAEAFRSGKVVPIPIECINIQGLDFSQIEKIPHKTKRKPAPLNLGPSPELRLATCDRERDSIALHDAAIKSATSLMSVMNDVLRSPPLSAHFAATTSLSPDSTPVNKRPRARTAPATPMYEAPEKELAELPGSMSLDDKSVSHNSQRLSTAVRDSVLSDTVRNSVRPRSSPQASTHAFPSRHNFQSTESVYEDARTQFSPRPSSEQKLHGPISVNQRPEDVPAVLPIQPGASNSSDSPPCNDTNRQSSVACGPPPQQHCGLVPTEQLHELRSSYEAHMTSLREAHQKEMAAHIAYVKLLEQQPKVLHVHENGDTDVMPTLQTRQLQLSMPESNDADARRNEQALKNTIETLQARLVAANNERIDVLAGFHEASEELRMSAEREKALIDELEDVRSSQHMNTKALQSEVATLKETLDFTRRDGARFNSLLQAEIRRQIRNAVHRPQTPLPEVDAQASFVVAHKKAQLSAQDRMQSPTADGNVFISLQRARSKIEMLEKELECCIKEIIMYKLDVKGYKKDLKKANIKIESLERDADFDICTPHVDETRTLTSSPSQHLQQRRDSGTATELVASTMKIQSGLGISVLELRKATPPQCRPPEKSESHEPTTPTSQLPANSKSPVADPKTPLQVDKKLPSLPLAEANSDSLEMRDVAKGQRVETRRSRSESVILCKIKTLAPKSSTCLKTPDSEPLPSFDFPTTPVLESGSAVLWH